MPKYLSGRQKRRPQDKLTEDRYQYLGLDQAEPNLADPATSPGVPAGAQFQLIAVSGYDGRRYWVPVGGDLQPGSITIFDEGSQVSGTSSITQLNFVGAAITAVASVQSPSGHPGVAATVTVIPVTVGDNPPVGAGTTNNGELWWESDTGDLYVYYNDGDSSQWVMANSGGRGLTGDKGATGDKGIQGQKGEIGTTGSQGDKGDKGEPSTVKGEPGDKGSTGDKVSQGDKGDAIKGDKGIKGDPIVINSNADDRVITGSDTVNNLNAEPKLTFDSDNVIATLNVTGNTNITGIATINNNLFVNGDLDVDRHTNLDNVSVSGITTFASVVRIQDELDANGGAQIDNVRIGIANDNEIDTASGNLTIDSQGGTTTIDDNLVVNGALDVNGVLTYEDVTNIDSVGVITARTDVHVGAGLSVAGIGTFNGDVYIGGELNLTKGTDSNRFIDASLGSNTLHIRGTTGGDASHQEMALFTRNGSVSLNFSGSKKFETTTDGVKIYGGLQDKDGDLGTSGQVLTSTGTELNWIPASTVGGSVDTTYAISAVDGINSDEERIRLTDSNGTTDDVTLEAGTGLSIARSGDKITFTNTDTGSSAQEKYDLLVPSGTTKIRLEGNTSSGNVNDDVEIAGTGSVSVTRTNQNKLTISAADSKYDLLVPSGTTKIRLEGTTSSGNVNDDITITGGSNISVTRTSATELNIASSATIDVTQLNLNRIRFGPNNTLNDDANIEWLGGNNAGYLRISTSDDGGTEYIELGDYDNLDVSGAFTQWAKLNRDEFYMARPVRLVNQLRDKDGNAGNNGQVLISTGSQVDWVDATTVGGSVDNYADSLSFSGGTLTLGRTGSLSNLTASIPLSGITGGFTDLDDTPGNYSGQANKVVVVNGSSNGLTFVDPTSVGTDNYYLTALSFDTNNGVLTATVNGASNPTVDLDGRYVQTATFQASIPTGSRMLFQQTAAPTGWTKDTSRNNRALRLVSGSVGDGGGNSFTGVFNGNITTNSGSVHSHTLTTAQIPSHFHYAFRSGNAGQLRNGSNMSSNNYPGSGTGAGNLYESYNITARNEVPNVGRTQSIGSSQGHSHGFTNPQFNLNVLYTDVIICTKN